MLQTSSSDTSALKYLHTESRRELRIQESLKSNMLLVLFNYFFASLFISVFFGTCLFHKTHFP